MIYESITDRCISIWYPPRACATYASLLLTLAAILLSAIPRGVPAQILADFLLEDSELGLDDRDNPKVAQLG